MPIYRVCSITPEKQGFIMIETYPEKVAHVTTYVAGTTAVVGGLAIHEYLAIGGFIIACLSFAVNLYYKQKHDRRQQRIEDRMK